MTATRIPDRELVFVEPEPTRFLAAVGTALEKHPERVVRIVGSDDRAQNFIDVVTLRYPKSDVATIEDLAQLPQNAIVLVFEARGEVLQNILMSFLDAGDLTVIAPETDWHFSRRPLFLITIPKAGTHLLYGLVEAFGYRRDITTEGQPRPGGWYCLEYTNSHTVARDFFVDYVRRKPHGGRDHPFPWTPTLFLYRNPLDIVVSEANYYHREGHTLFAPYLAGFDFDQRLLRLIDDPHALGSIRDRVSGFQPWLDCVNVVPLSFEEIVGGQGGGSDAVQTALVWSLQLKLQVPGDPAVFAGKAFDPTSSTFESGQIGRHRERFTEAAWDGFKRLPQDFMEAFGYAPDSPHPAMPRHAERFRTRVPRYLSSDADDTNFVVEQSEFYAIFKYKGRYYPVTAKTNSPDLATLDDEARSKLLWATTLDLARTIAFRNL